MHWLLPFISKVFVQVILFISCYSIEEEFSSEEKLLSDSGGLIKSVCRSNPQLKNTACAVAVAV